jgi:hypothetical protein
MTLLAGTLMVLALPHLGVTVTRTQEGLASTYWPNDGHSGTHCADGTRFTKERCHIAHRSWPLGHPVYICSKVTQRCTLTFVGDRGPFGACDDMGFIPGTFYCKGKWHVKIRKKDPGRWRGVTDMSRCVWKRLGGPGMQHVRLYLLKLPPHRDVRYVQQQPLQPPQWVLQSAYNAVRLRRRFYLT